MKGEVKKHDPLTTKKERNEGDEQQTLNIEITSYKSLHDILDSPLKVVCAICALLILTIAIFVGIGIITLTLKRMYPYSNIRTNALGATTLQNENKEITYWLFNTAELWANSGIKVKAGDILTIRASGKSHTAIHHLVEDAGKNLALRDHWVSTSGAEAKDSIRDKLRMQYRIFSGRNQDALIMQVVPEGIDMSDRITNENFLTFETPQVNLDEAEKKRLREHQENMYYIGNEKVNLRINKGGILHFAVNDIVLTGAIIEQMRHHNDSLINADPEVNTWEAGNAKYFSFGQNPKDKKTTKESNEMTYYKETNYYNAWFDDNVGSFLIIIEQNK